MTPVAGTEARPTSQATAALVLAFGTLAAFVVTVVPFPLWYQPMERVFAFGDKPHALVIDYYGRVLVVVVAVVVGALLGGRVALSDRVARLCFAWSSLLVALTIALAGVTLWNRPLKPLSPPSAPATSAGPTDPAAPAASSGAARDR